MYRVPSDTPTVAPRGKKRVNISRTVLFGSAAIAALIAATPTLAQQTIEWNGPGALIGDWSDAGEWIGGVVPDANSNVIINNAAAESNPTLSEAGAAATITIGTAGASGFLSVNAGQLTVGDITMGAADGSTGRFTVSNAGQANSQGSIQVGANQGSIGVATVSGAGSLWNHSGDMSVGTAGTGTVNITNGGNLIVSDGALTVGATGQIFVGTANADGGAQAEGGHLDVEDLNLDGYLQINQSDAEIGGGTSRVIVGSTLSGSGEIFVKRGDLYLNGDGSDFAGVINLSSNSATSSGNSSPFAWLHLGGNLGADAVIRGNLDASDEFSTTGKSAITLTGAGPTYTIAAQIDGYYRRFIKNGEGTVILSGDNNFVVSYAGTVPDTAIELNAGTLQISSDTNLGNSANAVSLNGGTLATTQDITASRNFALQSASGGFNVADATTFTIGGTLSGAGALNLAGGGILDIRNAAANYSGDVNVTSGSLIGNTDTILGDVANAGTVTFDQDIEDNFTGNTSGSGEFIKAGDATLSLTGAHSTDWTINEGVLAASAGLFTGNVEIADDATFRFDTTGTNTYAGSITGEGTFAKALGGTLTLSADNSDFAGDTIVGSGILLVDGSLGGDVAVAGLAGLGGAGSIGGNVTVADTGSLFGEQGETLEIGGNVELSQNSNVNVTLGAPEPGYNPALFDVGGDLTLDGTINVENAGDGRGNFRAGVYRIFDYAGDLTNNGLEVGGVPTGSDASNIDVQTAVGGQVNLVNSGGQDIHVWDGGLDANKNDGTIQGGDGIWRNGDANWANFDGSGNAGWNSGLAIFQGAAGTVTIDASEASGGAVSAGGLQFITDGYVITGNNLTLTGVDGEANIGTDTGVTATIDTVLEGTAQIDKWGAGTLIIESDSLGYGGSTLVSEGTLLVNGRLGGDVTVEGTLGGTGQIGGDVFVDGGKLVGRQGDTLSMGNLELTNDSTIDVELGAPGNTTGLFLVNGDLSLDGTINVSDAGGFGRGTYRVIDYTGELTDNELEVGLHPGSWDLSVQTVINNQINLVVGSDVQFWNGSTIDADGTIEGGDGTWRNDPRTNWTDENAQDSSEWQQNLFAVFQGTAGTVTVDNSAGQVSVGGMQFGIDGYTIVGDSIALNGESGPTVIRVGDGTTAGAEYTAVIGSELTGTSGLEKTDLGTLILTGENSYSGGTTITHGAIALGNGGTSGSIIGDVAIAEGAGLIFNRSNEYAFNGEISGSGIVGQIGSGTTLLTADSSGFGGTTEVLNGGLQVSGSLGGVINVRSGGLLDGSGTVGDVIVHSGGTIGAGTSNSIDEFFTGDLTFNSGSNYLVNVAADGTGDRIWSSGDVVINGGLVDVRAGSGDYADQTRYTIITADNGVTLGGPNEGFDNVTSDLAFLTPSLEYDDDNVYLVMDRNDFSFCLPGSTRNQCATGEGAESTGPGNPIYDSILNLTDPQARDAFDQLSGEIHASAMTAMIEDSRFVREATGDRIRSAFGVTNTPQQVITWEPGIDIKDPTPRMVVTEADQAQGLALWGHGFGSWGSFDGDGNAADLERDIGGLFIGADVPVFDAMRFGIVGGYSHSSFSIADRNSSGSSENYDLGIYGGGQWDQLGVRFGANHTWHNLSTSRSVVYPGFADSLSAEYDARTFQVYGDVGYSIEVGSTKFEPFAGLAHVNFKADGFTESGGAAALTGFGNTMDTTFSTIGLRAEHVFAAGEFELTASGMIGWRHAFGDTTSASTHQFEGGSPFTISGVPLAEDVAVIEAGLNAAINDAVSVGVSYSGQLGDGVSDHGLRGNLSWKF